MRRNLWEYNGSIHCTIIGHCLTITEQRKIFKKAKYNEKKIDDPDCHEILTNELSKSTPLSVRVQKYLDNKYKRELESWDELLDFEYLKVWMLKTKEAKIAGDLYALIRQSDIPHNDINKITGSLHVLAYNKVNHYESDNELYKHNTIYQLKEQLAKSKSQLNQYSKEIIKAEKTNTESEKEIKKLKSKIENNFSEVSQTQTYKNEIEILTEKINKKNNRIINLDKIVDNSKKREVSLEKKISEQQTIIEILTNELEKKEVTYVEEESECDNCFNKNLCEKRVLIVGGLSKLTSFYKNAVENMGGIFDYNNGYGKNGSIVLKESIQKADIILCPVDVNSHNACLSVKKYCKKMNKQYFMLRSSGLSSITKKITEIANSN